jgi:mRNA interferase MazF
MRLTQGNIVWLDFNPAKGQEQAGVRPAVVVSGNAFNKVSNNVIVCPITTTDKQYPAHIALDDRTETSGFVMCDQIRTVSPSARRAAYIEDLPIDILEDVLDLIVSVFE